MCALSVCVCVCVLAENAAKEEVKGHLNQKPFCGHMHTNTLSHADNYNNIFFLKTIIMNATILQFFMNE